MKRTARVALREPELEWSYAVLLARNGQTWRLAELLRRGDLHPTPYVYKFLADVLDGREKIKRKTRTPRINSLQARKVREYVDKAANKATAIEHLAEYFHVTPKTIYKTLSPKPR